MFPQDFLFSFQLMQRRVGTLFENYHENPHGHQISLNYLQCPTLYLTPTALAAFITWYGERILLSTLVRIRLTPPKLWRIIAMYPGSAHELN